MEYGKDYLRKATIDGVVRVIAGNTTDMVSEAQKVHQTAPTATAALGRLMTAGALMALANLKNTNDTLTLQIKGDGPLGGMVVVSDFWANVRGYAYAPETDLPLKSDGKLDVGGAVGKGYLNVIKDFGLKEPYVGYVQLVSGEIGEDIAWYYASSEQVPTVVALGVLVNPDNSVLASGGYMIQLMPDCPDTMITEIEQRLQQFPPVSQLIHEGMQPEAIIEKFFEGHDVQWHDELPCRFHCTCSRERMERNLLTLGRSELESLKAEQETVETQCHFCNTRYEFTQEDLAMMIDETA